MHSNVTRAEARLGSAYDAVSLILNRYLSELNADSLLMRALREASVRREHLAPSDIPGLISRLERGIRLFLDPHQQYLLRADLQRLAREYQEIDPEPQDIPISSEVDISTARLSVRAVCVDLGLRALIVQRIVTIVSELARNIVEYTPGGTIGVSVKKNGAARIMSIVAEDTGTGIENLDAIFAGRYRSRAGLGKGLIGVKRLADTFDIRTGPKGTCIRLEVHV